ncbi:MAG TPA: hypothetical protein PKZ32_22725, partial [Candidatus Melainabacteria bacterium]|nr:hypothetical protein [Candidatus Melainabacteria bacterium]
LPCHYLAKQLLITVPITVLALSFAGVGVCIYRMRFPRSSAELFLSFQVLMWLFVPLLFWAILRPSIYNGARHFLFVMPAFALLAGIALEHIFVLLKQSKFWENHRAWRHSVAIGLILLLLCPAISIAESHPYQNIFYNSFVASSSGAQGKYELEYTASTYKEGMDWIRLDAKRNGNKNPHVLVAANGYLLEALGKYAQNDLLYRVIFTQGVRGDLPDDCDYYLSTVQNDFHKNFDQASTAFSIKRCGAVLAVVKTPAKRSSATGVERPSLSSILDALAILKSRISKRNFS